MLQRHMYFFSALLSLQKTSLMCERAITTTHLSAPFALLSPSNSHLLPTFLSVRGYVWSSERSHLSGCCTTRERKVRDRRKEAFLLLDTNAHRLHRQETSMGLLIKSTSGWLGTFFASPAKIKMLQESLWGRTALLVTLVSSQLNVNEG